MQRVLVGEVDDCVDEVVCRSYQLGATERRFRSFILILSALNAWQRIKLQKIITSTRKELKIKAMCIPFKASMLDLSMITSNLNDRQQA